MEYDASRRAVRAIEAHRMLTGAELAGAQKVLQAAALTYVASLVVSVAMLIRFLLIFLRR